MLFCDNFSSLQYNVDFYLLSLDIFIWYNSVLVPVIIGLLKPGNGVSGNKVVTSCLNQLRNMHNKVWLHYLLDWYEQIIIIDEVCSVYIQRSIVQGQKYMTVGEYTEVKRWSIRWYAWFVDSGFHILSIFFFFFGKRLFYYSNLRWSGKPDRNRTTNKT